MLITAQGTAVLSDFGLATIPGQLQVSSSVNRGGHVRWMSAELIDYEPELEENGDLGGPTYQSDIFAFGMTVLQVSTANSAVVLILISVSFRVGLNRQSPIPRDSPTRLWIQRRPQDREACPDWRYSPATHALHCHNR